MAKYSIREERSNAGALALAQDVLTNVFGLTGDLASRLMDTIQTTGEMPALRQSIKLLPLSSHTRLCQIVGAASANGTEDTPFTDEDLDDDDTDQSMDSEMEFDVEPDVDDIEPDVDDIGTDDSDPSIPNADNVLDSMGVDKGELRNNADGDDFSAESRKDSYKESKFTFKSYLENAMVNAKLDAEISGNMDSDIDEQTLKKIKNLEAKGQTDSANQLRKQASRRTQANQSQQGGERPTQRRVLAKKKELARAIQADKEAQIKQGGEI